MYGERDRLSDLVHHICRVWDDELAEQDAKLRATVENVSQENERDRFAMQRAFRTAVAEKNNEINALHTELKRMKYLLTQCSAENRDLKKDLYDAQRKIQVLQGNADDISEHSGSTMRGFERESVGAPSSDWSPKSYDAPPPGLDHGGLGNMPFMRETEGGNRGRGGVGGGSGGYSELGGLLSSPPGASSGYPPSMAQYKPQSPNPEGLVFGGRFVIEENEFVKGGTGMASNAAGPPPGFASGPSSSPSQRTTSRLALPAEEEEVEEKDISDIAMSVAAIAVTENEETTEDATVTLNQIRLQTKSSKLDAVPVNPSEQQH